MWGKTDRFFNPQYGTYANVPLLPQHAEKFRGKRQFGTDVLIGNWYEDRSKVKSIELELVFFSFIDFLFFQVSTIGIFT